MDVKNSFLMPVSSKGQVTIPVSIRKKLISKSKKAVVFEVKDDQVFVKPVDYSIDDVYGSVVPIELPFKKQREIARTTRLENAK